MPCGQFEREHGSKGYTENGKTGADKPKLNLLINLILLNLS